MRNVLLPCAIFFFIMGAAALSLNANERLVAALAPKTDLISCSPLPPEKVEPNENGKFITSLPGWGSYSYKISTIDDSAQFYFNQGLVMYYSYHLREAVASFREAARFDPQSPMVYWGQALAMGPSYNAVNSYVIARGIPEVLQKMNGAIIQATDKEKKLIEVMNLRYPPNGANSQKMISSLTYALAMKQIMSIYPSDADIKALYVDAVMLVHPWNFWNNNGSAKEWTPELTGICETVLKTNPHHPAALHYYIHLTEASRRPEVGLPNAEALKKLFPGVAHMVHMSSHEYERNGLYDKGVEANEKADSNLVSYHSLVKNISLPQHVPHYFAVESYCALSGGMYMEGMRAANKCRNSVSPVHDNTYDQYLYMMPVIMQIRMGRWMEILQDSISPEASWPYAALLKDFAKGLAFVCTGHADSASACLVRLRERSKDPVMAIRRIPFNTASQGAGIAENLLDAAILFSQRQYDKSISAAKNAITIEDSMIYSEPRDWPIPARQFLGALLLHMNKFADAESVYKEDLAWNPGNGWSLLGVYQSRKARHKNKDLTKYKAGYLRAFSRADHIPPASVFMQ